MSGKGQPQVTLEADEVELLRQARRGAQSLGWLFTYLCFVIAIYWVAASGLGEGVLIRLGVLAVGMLTAWFLMLFFSSVSKWLVNVLLTTCSAKQRALLALERDEATKK